MLISFEGIDGTGKATQAALLQKHLNSIGIDCVYFDFPAYESFVGKEVGRLLSSDTSSKTHDALTLPPKLMAMLFALDRMQFYQNIVEAIANRQVVITNRYSLSNSVFQSIRAGEDISKWVDQLEHEALGLPRPDYYIVLLGSLSATKKLVAAKGERNYTESHDIYERNEELLKHSQELYKNITTPHSTKILINCISDSSIRTREDIHNEIITKIMPAMNKQHLQQTGPNNFTYLVNVSDRVWAECRSGYRIEFDCVERLLKSLSHDEYSKIENIFIENRTLEIYSRLINEARKLSNASSQSEIYDLCVFVVAVSYASNVINDMVHYSPEMRDKISKEICDTLNINNDDIINLDREWGRLFYSM